jgi:tetratricopeptide (TPR) repeat protein
MSLLANVHADREEFDEAIALLEALAKRFPNRLTVLEPLATCCVSDFRFDEGRPALQRLIELEGDEHKRSEHREKLLESYLVFGEFDEALQLVEGWIEKQPENDDLLFNEGIILLRAGRKPEASATFEEWLDRKPHDPERRKRFCDTVKFTQEYERAVKRIREWLDADPANATLTQYLIDVLIWADRADEALEVARKFEGTYAESITRRIWLGRCQSARGETDKALEEFDALLGERLIETDQRAEAWKQIVHTLANADRLDEALTRCDEWLKTAESLGDLKLRIKALHWKREVLQTAGRDREGAEVMEALLAYVPGIALVLDIPGYNAGLFNDLGYVWADVGMNLEQATQLVRLALAAEPWNAAFIDSLGWAYYKAGDFDNAHKYLVRATRLRDGQDPVVYDHLADAASRLGDPKTAGQHWRKVLSLIETSLNEHETPKPERRRLANLAEAVRAKLAALERSEAPALAPTAAEQHKE